MDPPVGGSLHERSRGRGTVHKPRKCLRSKPQQLQSQIASTLSCCDFFAQHVVPSLASSLLSIHPQANPEPQKNRPLIRVPPVPKKRDPLIYQPLPRSQLEKGLLESCRCSADFPSAGSCGFTLPPSDSPSLSASGVFCTLQVLRFWFWYRVSRGTCTAKGKRRVTSLVAYCKRDQSSASGTRGDRAAIAVGMVGSNDFVVLCIDICFSLCLADILHKTRI